jgi:GNAT superfamily N-acetyltransferase
MALRLREATVADAAALAALGEQTFRETFQAFNAPEDLEAFLARTYGESIQKSELEDRANTCFLAEVSGQFVGYATLRPGPPEPCVTGERPLELARIYVLREWQGQGVAVALMDACLAEARTQGAFTLWLGVWEKNHRAQAFYRKFGFTDVGWHLFQIGQDPQHDRIFARRV